MVGKHCGCHFTYSILIVLHSIAKVNYCDFNLSKDLSSSKDNPFMSEKKRMQWFTNTW